MTGIAAHLPALQVLLPMLVSPLVMLLRPRGLAWAVTVATSLMALVVAVEIAATALSAGPLSYQMGGWPPPFGIELRIDTFNALLLLVVNGASTLALLGGRKSLDSEIETARQPFFFVAWLLALAGLNGILVTGDAFNIFVFMEISSLASYILIAGGPDRRALPSVFNYLIMGTVGATFYLIGVGLIYMMTGTLNLADLDLRINSVADQMPILLAAGFITIGLALKAAIFPLHVWLPRAYTYAPHIVTVFLAACATKVPLYVLLRFDFVIFQGNLAGHAFQFTSFLMPLAILGILVGSAVAMFEVKLKRLLAYSSVAQIGYIMLGASLLSTTGLTASTLHMFNHALAKGGLFLVLAGFATVVSDLRMDKIQGIAARMPWTFAAFVLAGFSLIGMPGTAGFISKWYLISASLELGTPGYALVALIVISSLMAVVYIWRIVEVACFQQPPANQATPGTLPPALFVTIWVVAIANVYFGLVPALPLSLSRSAADILLGQMP